MRMKKKGFMEISFAWLFAIIAGAVILVLAIFAATKDNKSWTILPLVHKHKIKLQFFLIH